MHNSIPVQPYGTDSILYVGTHQDLELTERVSIAAGQLGLAVRQERGDESHKASQHTPCAVVAVFAEFGSDEAAFFNLLNRTLPGVPIVVILGNSSVTEAAHLARAGAFECFPPSVKVEHLISALQKAVHRVSAGAVSPAAESDETRWRKFLVGQSPPIEQLAKVIRLVASRRSTVLISGETGTGKEVVARAIHQAGNRSDKPMVAVNCGALPEHLIEAELFGHMKGAFTGATENRVGRFQQAEGGTIFLDEIGDLPYDLQATLLRVIQEREIQRLGSAAAVKVDVRVIAATNANLLAKVQQGTFREDLYYRLNVIPIHVPALRERIADIPVLTNHFVSKICKSEGLLPKLVTADAINLLSTYSWPGNVRQLENIVEQSLVMNDSKGPLTAADFRLPKTAHPERLIPIAFPNSKLPEEGLDLTQALRQFERALLHQALMRTQGNKTLAADMLRVPRTTLIHKLRSLEDAA